MQIRHLVFVGFFVATFVYVFFITISFSILSLWQNPQRRAEFVEAHRASTRRPPIRDAPVKGTKEVSREDLSRLQYYKWRASYMRRIAGIWKWMWMLTHAMIVIGWNALNLDMPLHDMLYLNIAVIVTVLLLKLLPRTLEFYRVEGWFDPLTWINVLATLAMALGVWYAAFTEHAWIFFALWSALPIALACTMYLLVYVSRRHEFEISRGAGKSGAPLISAKSYDKQSGHKKVAANSDTESDSDDHLPNV